VTRAWVSDADLLDEVAAVVTTYPGLTSNQVVRQVGRRRERVLLAALRALEVSGRLRVKPGLQGAENWFLKAGNHQFNEEPVAVSRSRGRDVPKNVPVDDDADARRRRAA